MIIYLVHFRGGHIGRSYFEQTHSHTYFTGAIEKKIITCWDRIKKAVMVFDDSAVISGDGWRKECGGLAQKKRLARIDFKRKIDPCYHHSQAMNLYIFFGAHNIFKVV